MRDQLEQNILDHPDDEAPRLIYADWLEENGDPDRAEFIRTQIALAGSEVSESQRQSLTEREAALLAQHQRTWLGELAPYLLDNEGIWTAPFFTTNCNFEFRKGFPEVVQWQYLSYHIAKALSHFPEAKWIIDLAICDVDPEHLEDELLSPEHEREVDKYKTEDIDWVYRIFQANPHLKNVRKFRIGYDCEIDESTWQSYGGCFGSTIPNLVGQMPRLEELHLMCDHYDLASLFRLPTLSNLRVFRSYHLGDRVVAENERRYAYELELLAENPAAASLEVLQFHPHNAVDSLDSFLPLEKVRCVLDPHKFPKLRHLQLRMSDMGNEGCKVIVESGILKQLKVLDLQHGCITDEGARMLAACPDIANLEWLDLTGNALENVGPELFEPFGVKLYDEDQQYPAYLEERDYLFQGDME